MTDPEIELSFSETSPFVQLLARPSQVKILDTVLRRPSSTLTAEEIAEQAGIDVSSFSRNKDIFIRLQIIQEIKTNGQTTYELNTNNEAVKHLGRAHGALLREAQRIYADSEFKLPTRRRIDETGIFHLTGDQGRVTERETERESRTEIEELIGIGSEDTKEIVNQINNSFEEDISEVSGPEEDSTDSGGPGLDETDDRRRPINAD